MGEGSGLSWTLLGGSGNCSKSPIFRSVTLLVLVRFSVYCWCRGGGRGWGWGRGEGGGVGWRGGIGGRGWSRGEGWGRVEGWGRREGVG